MTRRHATPDAPDIVTLAHVLNARVAAAEQDAAAARVEVERLQTELTRLKFAVYNVADSPWEDPCGMDRMREALVRAIHGKEKDDE